MSDSKSKIKLFEEQHVRAVWDEKRNETVTNCHQLKITAPDISIVRQPIGFNESAAVAKEGANAAKVAREQIEKSTGKTAVSKLNAKELRQRRLPRNAGEEANDKGR